MLRTYAMPRQPARTNKSKPDCDSHWLDRLPRYQSNRPAEPEKQQAWNGQGKKIAVPQRLKLPFAALIFGDHFFVDLGEFLLHVALSSTHERLLGATKTV